MFGKRREISPCVASVYRCILGNSARRHAAPSEENLGCTIRHEIIAGKLFERITMKGLKKGIVRACCFNREMEHTGGSLTWVGKLCRRIAAEAPKGEEKV